jgi:hypothetical protein
MESATKNAIRKRIKEINFGRGTDGYYALKPVDPKKEVTIDIAVGSDQGHITLPPLITPQVKQENHDYPSFRQEVGFNKPSGETVTGISLCRSPIRQNARFVVGSANFVTEQNDYNSFHLDSVTDRAGRKVPAVKYPNLQQVCYSLSGNDSSGTHSSGFVGHVNAIEAYVEPVPNDPAVDQNDPNAIRGDCTDE